MISSLLFQAASWLTAGFTLQQLNILYETSNKGKIHSAKDIGNTLILILKAIPSIFYIAIDAMDECQDQAKAFSLLNKLLEEVKHGHILLTSRPHVYNFILSEKNLSLVELGDEDIGSKSDIEMHVDMKLQTRKLSDGLKNEIREALINGANGQ